MLPSEEKCFRVVELSEDEGEGLKKGKSKKGQA